MKKKDDLLRAFLVFSCLFLSNFSFSQRSFPKGEFIDPLTIPIELAGSFAECRPNHFHTGIDIKTNNKENLTVRAAADGYISRISISSTGYGNCLYMTHPNGYTSVYGHLNHFVPELMAYLKIQQYKQEKWNVDLKLPADSFSFKQGQQIAFSGNTGGSTAPHLHFEIRDTKTEEVFNPLFFGFDVKDNISPKAQHIAFYNAEDYYGTAPNYFNLPAAKNNQYNPGAIVLPFSKVYVGVDAKDYVNGSTNWLGIKALELYVDGKLTTKILIDGLLFSQNRAINAFADFRSYMLKGYWLMGLYHLPNNPLSIYQKAIQNGLIDLSDGQSHNIKIVMVDAFDNSSEIEQTLSYKKPAGNSKSSCKVYFSSQKTNYYCNFTRNIFLETSPNCFYDKVCVEIKEKLNPGGLSGKFEVLSPEIPAHDYFKLQIKLYNPIPREWESKLVFIHKIPQGNLPGANSQTAQKAEFDWGYAVAKSRTFGAYYVALDTIAPAIKQNITSDKTKISFTINENLTSIKNFNAYLNGKWTCFSRIGNTFSYHLNKDDPKGTLKVRIKVMDENENDAENTFVIKHK